MAEPYHFYSSDFIAQAVKQALAYPGSLKDLSIKLGLKSSGLLYNWLRAYKQNGYNMVRQKGRDTHEAPAQIKQKAAPTEGRLAPAGELAAAYREFLYKKTANLGTSQPQTVQIAQAITELRQKYRVSVTTILQAIAAHPTLPQIARSTYYYTLAKADPERKNKTVITRIKAIFAHHQGRYGYRRITLQLRREGLAGLRRHKRKYSSYRGTVGRIASNLIQRNFFALRPNMKWYTDITEFSLQGQKLYLSPILDGCGGDIVSYTISRHPDLKLVMTMLERAFTQHPALNGCTFHTDQGVQYQSYAYQRALKLHGITQSMSRKGNSLDDGLMENFFGLLKTEMFYGQEERYRSLADLEQAITDYIAYYNNERIKCRLKGLTPIEYRR